MNKMHESMKKYLEELQAEEKTLVKRLDEVRVDKRKTITFLGAMVKDDKRKPESNKAGTSSQTQ